MLNMNQDIAEQFVGGTVYRTFLSAMSHHISLRGHRNSNWCRGRITMMIWLPRLTRGISDQEQAIQKGQQQIFHFEGSFHGVLLCRPDVNLGFIS